MKRPRNNNLGFKLRYTRKIRLRNAADIVLDKEGKRDILDIKGIGNPIILLKFVEEQDTFDVISPYTSQAGLE